MFPNLICGEAIDISFPVLDQKSCEFVEFLVVVEA
jgi:hypothetical protein